MKILLLGANGQVGYELQRALAPLGELQPATRSGKLPGGADCLAADLGDAVSLAQALKSTFFMMAHLTQTPIFTWVLR